MLLIIILLLSNFKFFLNINGLRNTIVGCVNSKILSIILISKVGLIGFATKPAIAHAIYETNSEGLFLRIKAIQSPCFAPFLFQYSLICSAIYHIWP